MPIQHVQSAEKKADRPTNKNCPTANRRLGVFLPLASLHWLPVCFRIDFKILLFVFKILNGLAPAYLSELLHVHTPVKALRSSSQVLLNVTRARLKNKDDRVFSLVAHNLWNSLPVHIRTAQTGGIFKSLLKG